MADNTILCMDCVKGMNSLGVQCQLVFGDPPFNIGQGYAGFGDKLSPAEYYEFTWRWIDSAWKCVGDGGVLVVYGCIKLRPAYWRSIIELNLDKHFENEIAWHYRFGQCRDTDWVDAHCPAIVLRKPGERTWHPDNVLVESDRLKKYGDKRVAKSKRGGMRVPGTVWGVPSDGPRWGRVTGNNPERRKQHPNQLPENLVRRLVGGYTGVGDYVLDVFSGSGTVSAVCKKMGRNSIAFDVSAESVESASERVLEVKDGSRIDEE